ncbi:MAG: ABC transporter permease [Verrucomicrobia bacterium]|nr:ABC transporter permease [Verrucomicrobiota bacterium]
MSRLPFELTLALRYLRPKRRLVSVITLISVIGVMLGVAVLIIVIAVMSGFDQQLRGKLAAYTAHLRLEARTGLLSDYEPLMAAVAQHRSVRGVTPYVGGPVLLKTQPAEGSPAFHVPSVLGVDPHSQVPLSAPCSKACGPARTTWPATRFSWGEPGAEARVARGGSRGDLRGEPVRPLAAEPRGGQRGGAAGGRFHRERRVQRGLL